MEEPGQLVFERPAAGGQAGQVALVRHVLRFDGVGGAVAEEAKARANALVGPFAFRWEKAGFWPGSWRLLSVDHADLRVSSEEIRKVLDWEESY